MRDSPISWFRGLRLLRRPALVRRLGEIWRDEEEIAEIRRRYPGVRIDSTCQFDGWREGELFLGPGSQVCRGTTIVFGDLRNGYGAIHIGKGTFVGSYNNLRCAAGTRLQIGEDCLISQFCNLIAANHRFPKDRRIKTLACEPEGAGVTLGDDVWLGAGTTVLPGAHIATGAVIGAGSVVTRSVPEYEIWAGAPARRVGERT